MFLFFFEFCLVLFDLCGQLRNLRFFGGRASFAVIEALDEVVVLLLFGF